MLWYVSHSPALVKLRLYVESMYSPLPDICRPYLCMLHVQMPTTRYCDLGKKWYSMLTRLKSASVVARSASCLSRGSPSRAFRYPIRIISNPLGAACSTCSTKFMSGTLFEGTYTPTTYQRLNPHVSRKLTTLGTKLYVLSTCILFAAFQTTDTLP